MDSFAQRVQELSPEGAYHAMAKAKAMEAQGREIVHLELGEPDFLAAPHVAQAGMDAIAEGQTRYNPPSGLPQLREAIAEVAGAQRGIEVKPSQVVVSPGAKPNLFFPTLALVEPGDEVIYPDPGFPSYAEIIKVAGGKLVPVPLLEENDFSFDLDAFDELVNPKTKVIFLNSPSNPTGGVMPVEDLAHIAEAAIENDCWVFSDEIYARIVFDGLTAPSIAALPGMLERTVIVDGFSKTYAMGGWRLGFGIMPESLADRMNMLITHSLGCTANSTQLAGIEALRGSQVWVDEMVAAYQERRDVLVAGLNDIPGVQCRNPQGAFYVFPNIRSFGMTSAELANYFLEQAGVALLPGTSFGKNGEGYLRVAYANSLKNIENAIEKIGDALSKL